MKNSKERIKYWNDLGLLEFTPDDRKEFVSDVLELSITYMRYRTLNSETILLSILTRIGKIVDFGIGDLFSIFQEVEINYKNLPQFDEIDVEAEFCAYYSNKKIIELQNKYK